MFLPYTFQNQTLTDNTSEPGNDTPQMTTTAEDESQCVSCTVTVITTTVDDESETHRGSISWSI